MLTRRATLPLILAAILGTAAGSAGAQDAVQDHGWPREIPSEAGTILIYTPQVDSFSMDLLAGRAAVSLTREAGTEPVFGAVWFTSRVVTDRDADTVAFTDIHLLRVRVPGLRGDAQKAFVAAIEKAANDWRLGESLARFTYTVEAARQARATEAGLRHTPPRVAFAREPTVLVAYDGEPQLRPIAGTGFERAINAPYVVIHDPKAKAFYLTGGRHWYTARAALGPWTYLAKPPADVAQLVPRDSAATAADSGPPRKIMTATEPTELVVTAGEPLLVPISGTDLLYISNTESDLFKELESQGYFLLLSGRWFRSRTLAGPWSYVPPEELPATFAKIPPGSPRSDVLASVPGTEAANDAVADAAIPQTAAVKRSAATLEVTYDGAPRFEPVEGTRLAYAVNASTAVLRIDGLYYACDQAIWFVSPIPTGPWKLSDSVPPAVKTIPPSSPVYYVKFVEIYQATPDVVYVGYTPGYVGSYPYHGTIVYGTGWYYRPYVGRVYYAWPWTWGLCAHYRPWYGWGFGVSYDWGFLIIGVAWGGGYHPHYRPRGWYGGGWYGPGGYRPPHHRPPRPRPGVRPPGYRPRPATNIYTRPETRPMVIMRPPVRDLSRPAGPARETTEPAPPLKRQNNVYVDPGGEIERRTTKGWETFLGNQWKPAREAKPAPRAPETRPTPREPAALPKPEPPATQFGPQRAPERRTVDRERQERDYRARTRPTPEPAPRAAPRPAPAPKPAPKAAPIRPAPSPAPRPQQRPSVR